MYMPCRTQKGHAKANMQGLGEQSCTEKVILLSTSCSKGLLYKDFRECWQSNDKRHSIISSKKVRVGNGCMVKD